MNKKKNQFDREKAKAFVNVKPTIEDKNCFDNIFFGYTEKESSIMNPNYRIFHECVWEALEDSGYFPDAVGGNISLYAGCNSDLNWRIYAELKNRNQLVNDFKLKYMSDRGHLASLISYKLNLKGPAFFVDTACSTSLSCVHLACRGLLLGEAKLAIAGGISLGTDTSLGYYHEEGMINSSDGHCRAFDKKSSGTVPSEGVGVVVLKRLDEAIADKDHIYGVIKASSANNDGNRKVGYTAPSVEGQMECIKLAQRTAGIKYNLINYIETHGTGTRLGDPIEVEALNMAFENDNSINCPLGSVKTNIGHTDYASGVIGLIKTVLCLKNKQLPASLNFENPNPMINFNEGPFYVNTGLKTLEKTNTPLIFGLSSFGIGGTNIHMILEEAPETSKTNTKLEYKILPISSKNSESLKKYISKLIFFLKETKDVDLEDVSYTLSVGRKHFDYRHHVVFRDRDELLNNLEKIKGHDSLNRKKMKPIVFAFSGRGAQYVNIGKELYKSEPVFKAKIDECFKIINEINQIDCSKVLFQDVTSKNLDKINDVIFTDLILFSIQYAIANVIQSLGVQASCMLGIDTGELVCLCLSNVLSLKEALSIVAKRSELLKKCTRSTKLVVFVSPDKALKYVNENIVLRTLNSNSEVVFSGTSKEIDELQKQLTDVDIISSKLSSRNYDVLDDNFDRLDFENCISRVNWKPPETPIISCVTGQKIDLEKLKTIDYWMKLTFDTLNCIEGLNTLKSQYQNALILEFGLNSYSQAFKQLINNSSNQLKPLEIIRHINSDSNENELLLRCLGQIWQIGVDINWKTYLNKSNQGRIPLPTYSFIPNKFASEVNIEEFFNQIFDKPGQCSNINQYENATQQSENNGNDKAFINQESDNIITMDKENIAKRLKLIFEDILEVSVELDEEFMDIGGDSLSGMLLINAINKNFLIDLKLNDLFDLQTIQKITEYIISMKPVGEQRKTMVI